jgi:ABC-type glycerol-3-phosphate transport system substrate-binding protein
VPSSTSHRALSKGTHRPATRDGPTKALPRSFRIEHWEYDADLLDGFDYDIGSTLLRSADAANEVELLTVLREWQLDPDQFQYAWDTADPR